VEDVVWVRNVPFTYRPFISSTIAIDGFVTEPGEQPEVEYNEVGPNYLATAGIPLTSGREFTVADNETSLPVAIVNQTMVNRFWRGQDPIGKRIQVRGRWRQVVGVAKDSKYSSLLETSKPFFYTPLRQSAGGVNLQIRTRLSLDFMANALTREVKAIDANLAPGELITMREQLSRRSWSERAAVSLLIVFGSIALLLAGIGLYGVMSYSVSQSTRELGLRMALGARASDLLRIVLSHALGLTLGGIAAGVALALGLTRLMGDLLYKVSPRDPAAFVFAFLIMILASLTASFFPALRATGTDPLTALRSDG
jgi:putative ABC transport system permease protein